MTNSFRRARRFLGDRRAVAIVEFAWVFPVAMLVIYSAFNLARLANAERELTELSDDMAQMIVETPNNTNKQTNGANYCWVPPPEPSAPAPYTNSSLTCGALYDYTLKYIYDSAMLEFPGIFADASGIANHAVKAPSAGGTLSISMTGVAFAYTSSASTCGSSPSVSNGSCYTGYVVWTAGAAARPCGTTFLYSASYSTPTPSQLPPSLFTTVANPNGSGALPPQFAVAVDIVYTFNPLLLGGGLLNVVPPVTIKRSTFLNPRYVSQISYFGAGNSTTNYYGQGTYGTACAKPAGWPGSDTTPTPPASIPVSTTLPFWPH